MNFLSSLSRTFSLPSIIAVAITAFRLASCDGLASTIVFQQGLSPTGSYAHLSQDIRGNGATNNTAQTLVGQQSSGVLQIRTVMGFDLSAIPAGSTIDSITLTLVSDGNQSGTIAGVGPVNLHEVIPNGVASNNMVEGQVSSVNWKTGSAWTNTLGDYTATPLSSAVLSNDNANTLLDLGEKATFPTSTAFVGAAQASFDAGQPLEFILIAPTAEAATTTNNFFRFASDDYVTTPASRPLLTVNFTSVPEPAPLGFLIGGAMLMFVRRSSRRGPR